MEIGGGETDRMDKEVEKDLTGVVEEWVDDRRLHRREDEAGLGEWERGGIVCGIGKSDLDNRER